ncbi:hypothetical protein D9613_003960 [Agrocybe pediades]|uniref:Cytochrome P450 n=1 Tax=Agrocybe pediades TaxID=84607 RepID=A0A8H4QIS6_9AGAR|nr:hypothetical protein D9613_003960 [Agrocybe pediades]
MSAPNSSIGSWQSLLSRAMDWSSASTDLSVINCSFALAFCFLAYTLSSYNTNSKSADRVYELPGSSLIHAWFFFYRRFDFIQKKFKESGGRPFRFKVLQHRIIAISGEKARQAFFSEATLSLSQGYRILTGGSPDLKDLELERISGKDLQREVDETFVRKILSLVRRDRIADTLPSLLDDCEQLMNNWGIEGRLNPFEEIYLLVFQMTVRMATCRELAEDKKAFKELANQYWIIQNCSTPISLLFPWFPSPMKKRKDKATAALYGLLYSFVMLRRNSPRPSTDPIDLLIAQGDSDENIVGTIMGVIFTGVINTGIISCWTLLYLSSNEEWKQKAEEEIRTMLDNHNLSGSAEPLHRRLASIPLNVWEDELPSVDLIIRETLRVVGAASIIRRNVQDEVVVDGILIQRGDFLTYQVADAHMNSAIYTDPGKFDPSRYLEGREEDKKETFSFLGWGVGRHPCAGMRMAKLEIKLVLSLFLLGYEYTLVDKSGKFPKTLPRPDRNDDLHSRPLGDPCYLQYRKRSEEW